MLLSIAAFIFVLSIVVLVHELGHFVVAKLNGIYVITFSIGFGPKLIKKRIGETEYAISALPFGGYVKFAGEDQETEEEEDTMEGAVSDRPDEVIPEERLYRSKNPYQRMSVVVAGPVMNAVLALLIYIITIWAQGVFVLYPSDVVYKVVEGSAAEKAGFMAGDKIISVDGKKLKPGTEVSDLVDYEEGKVSDFLIVRHGDTLRLSAAPEYSDEAKQMKLGIQTSTEPVVGDVQKDGPAYRAGIRTGAVIIAINDTTVYSYSDMTEKIYKRKGIPMEFKWLQGDSVRSAVITPEPMDAPSGGDRLDVIKVGAIGISEYYMKSSVSFPSALKYGWQSYGNLFMSIMDFLGKLVSGKASIRAVGGPIRVGVMAGEMVRWGFNYLINFLAFFSMNLAIFNLLPILPFDGGHFVMFIFEAATGIKPGRRVQNVMMQAGFFILIALMVTVLFLDVFNLIR